MGIKIVNNIRIKKNQYNEFLIEKDSNNLKRHYDSEKIVSLIKNKFLDDICFFNTENRRSDFILNQKTHKQIANKIVLNAIDFFNMNKDNKSIFNKHIISEGDMRKESFIIKIKNGDAIFFNYYPSIERFGLSYIKKDSLPEYLRHGYVGEMVYLLYVKRHTDFMKNIHFFSEMIVEYNLNYFEKEILNEILVRLKNYNKNPQQLESFLNFLKGKISVEEML